MDRIVELLPGTPREEVQKAVTEQESVVAKFVALLLKDEDQQPKKKKADAIVVDKSGCKPAG